MKKYVGICWKSILAGLLILFLSEGCAKETGEKSGSPQTKEEAKPSEETRVETTEGLNKEALMNPNDPAMNQEAPAEYQVKFETSRGDFVIKVTKDWAPQGSNRFYNLVKNGFYDDVRFFRVLPGFVAQFGIQGNPEISAKWRTANIQDDPVKEKNTRGKISFATAGPNTRTTQVFINYKDNSNLDGMGFSPFGEVIQGMEIVDALYSEYGEGAPMGKGPDQGKIQSEGNAYLVRDF